MTKKRFNMIEVVLALGITAIGIVGILAVFPVGLKTANKAIAESYVADLANGFLDEIDVEPGLLGSDANHETDVISKNNPDIYSTEAKRAEQITARDAMKYADYGSYSHNINIDPNVHYCNLANGDKIIAVVSTANGADQVDFSVERLAWKEFPNAVKDSGGTLGFASQDSLKLVRVYVEYSWPVSAPYGDREKRLFMREYLLEKAQ